MDQNVRIKRALISVADKSGVLPLAQFLEEKGVEMISTGGTYKLLDSNGIPVTSIETVTGSPEILGGRVKTLHPKIHGGLLARRDLEEDRSDMERIGISPIDLVVVNLYPFEQTIAKADVTMEEAIEQIDIGGVTLIRAAAKNYKWVTVVTSPSDYGVIQDEMDRSDGSISLKTRERLAVGGFKHTMHYDTAISGYLDRELS